MLVRSIPIAKIYSLFFKNFFQHEFGYHQIYSSNEQMINNYLKGYTMIKSLRLQQRTQKLYAHETYIYNKCLFFIQIGSNRHLDLPANFSNVHPGGYKLLHLLPIITK